MWSYLVPSLTHASAYCEVDKTKIVCSSSSSLAGSCIKNYEELWLAYLNNKIKYWLHGAVTILEFISCISSRPSSCICHYYSSLPSQGAQIVTSQYSLSTCALSTKHQGPSGSFEGFLQKFSAADTSRSTNWNAWLYGCSCGLWESHLWQVEPLEVTLNIPVYSIPCRVILHCEWLVVFPVERTEGKPFNFHIFCHSMNWGN